MNNAKSLLKWAVFLLGACGFLHLVGAREETVVLTGANLGPGSLLGLMYVAFWLAAVAVAPVLLIAAVIEGLSAAISRLWTTRCKPSST